MTTPVDDFPANPGTAGKLAAGTTVSGNFESGWDVDWFAIDLVAGDRYLFGLRSTGVVPFSTGYAAYGVAVFDGNGVVQTPLLSGTDIESPVLEYAPATSGRYYVAAVSNYYWYGLGGYELSAAIRTGADDHPASPATDGVLLPGGTVSGKFEVAGDHDWYRFHAETGVHYEFKAIGPAIGDPPGPQVWPSWIRIVDAHGNLVQADAPGFDPAVSGDYFIDVLGLTAGNYTVVSKTWNDDYPENNGTGGLLAPDGEIGGSIDYEDDVDRIKVTLEAQTFYTFTLTGPYNYFDLTLRDADGVRIDYRLGNNGGNGLQLVFHPAVAGDYYMDVSHLLQTQQQVDAIPYTLRLGTGQADDVGDTRPTASAASVGVPAAGVLQAAVDVDMFKFPLQAGITYAFAPITPGGLAENDLRLTLFDAASVLGRATFETGTEPWLRFTPTASGDYYIGVGTGTYGAHSYILKSMQLTGDTSGPALVSTSHPQGATGIALTGTAITLAFSEPITIDWSGIVLKDSAGNKVNLGYNGEINASYPIASDQTLYIKTQQFFKPGSYTLSILKNAVHDLAGNQYLGPESFTFTTVAPTSTPTNGNDLLQGGTGATIDGGSGLDTVVYPDYSSSYDIKRTPAGVTVASGNSSTTDTLVGIERLLFASDAYAFDIEGNAGQAYRLYQAAFHRTPDRSGLGYWIGQLDKGIGLRDVARSFVGSAEFASLYGATPGDADYVNLLYNNILHRSGEQAGIDYWTGALQHGVPREDLLMYFSESAENRDALAPVIGNGFFYTPY
jgi:methionine-rich copper-binding protein CopC